MTRRRSILVSVFAPILFFVFFFFPSDEKGIIICVEGKIRSLDEEEKEQGGGGGRWWLGEERRRRRRRDDDGGSYRPSKDGKNNDWSERLREASVDWERENNIPGAPRGRRKEQLNDEWLWWWWSEPFRTTAFVTSPPSTLWDGLMSAATNVYRGFAAAGEALYTLPTDGLQREGIVGLVVGGMAGVVSHAALAAGGVVTGAYQLALGLGRILFIRGGAGEEETGVGESSSLLSKEGRPYFLEEEVAELDRMFAEATATAGEGRGKFGGEESNLKSTAEREKASVGDAQQQQQQRPRLRHGAGAGGDNRRIGGDHGRGHSRRVRDKIYYDMLKVSPDATTGEIKKAYYQEALRVHPDKRPGDERAEETFRKLSSAYQTLSHVETREAYDKHGRCYAKTISDADEYDGAEKKSVEIPDPYVFFAVVFGTELAMPYVGELRIASVIDNFAQLSGLASQTMLLDKNPKTGTTLQQQRRQAKIALHLLNRIKPYVETKEWSERSFRDSCRIEAETIASGSDYGNVFLIAIGSALVMESEQFLGYHHSSSTILGGWGGHKAMAKRVALDLWRGLCTGLSILKPAWHCLVAITMTYSRDGGKSGHRKQSNNKTFSGNHRGGDEDDDEFECGEDGNNGRERYSAEEAQAEILMKNLEHALPSALQFAWAFNARDIAFTLREACAKLFADRSSPNVATATAGDDSENDDGSGGDSNNLDISKKSKRRISEKEAIVAISRAEAIGILGQEFLTVGKEGKRKRKKMDTQEGKKGAKNGTSKTKKFKSKAEESKRIKERLEAAFMASLAAI